MNIEKVDGPIENDLTVGIEKEEEKDERETDFGSNPESE